MAMTVEEMVMVCGTVGLIVFVLLIFLDPSFVQTSPPESGGKLCRDCSPDKMKILIWTVVVMALFFALLWFSVGEKKSALKI